MLENKLKNNYVMVVQKDDKNKYRGNLILKEEDKVLDLIKLNESDMTFIELMSFIKEEINNGKVLVTKYNSLEDKYSTSVISSDMEYNSESTDFLSTIYSLDYIIYSLKKGKEKVKCKKI